MSLQSCLLGRRGGTDFCACIDLRLLSLPNPTFTPFFSRLNPSVTPYTLTPIQDLLLETSPRAACLSIYPSFIWLVFLFHFPWSSGEMVIASKLMSNLQRIFQMYKTFICNFLLHIYFINKHRGGGWNTLPTGRRPMPDSRALGTFYRFWGFLPKMPKGNIYVRVHPASKSWSRRPEYWENCKERWEWDWGKCTDLFLHFPIRKGTVTFKQQEPCLWSHNSPENIYLSKGNARVGKVGL